MDRLDAMGVLLAVAGEGSLSAGARRLGTPLATVSRKMSELERHVGAQLLVRSSRRITLTEAGAAFVVASRAILDRVEAAERAAAGEYSEPRGELAVTAPVVFGRRHVLPLTLGFLSAYPRIDLRLLLMDRQVSLADERIDIAVRIGRLEDSALQAIRVGTVRHIMCASPSYLAERGTPSRPDQLATHDGISFRSFAVAPEWRYRGDTAEPPVRPRTRVAVNDTEAAVAAALAGAGIARLLSYQIADELRAGTLVAVLEPFAPEPIPVQLVHAAPAAFAVKARAFIDWIVPRLRSRIQALDVGREGGDGAGC